LKLVYYHILLIFQLFNSNITLISAWIAFFANFLQGQYLDTITVGHNIDNESFPTSTSTSIAALFFNTVVDHIRDFGCSTTTNGH